jgi:hypothetical protein
LRVISSADSFVGLLMGEATVHLSVMDETTVHWSVMDETTVHWSEVRRTGLLSVPQAARWFRS